MNKESSYQTLREAGAGDSFILLPGLEPDAAPRSSDVLGPPPQGIAPVTPSGTTDAKILPNRTLALPYLTRLFNDTLVAIAVAHATKLGIMDELGVKGRVSLKKLASQNHLDIRQITQIGRLLQLGNIVTMNDEYIIAGARFSEALAAAGFFEWMLIGYGGLVTNWDVGSQRSHAVESGRHGAAVASGSARIGNLFVDPVLLDVVYAQPFRSVIDLGCGAAQRLIQLTSANASLAAIGIELDAKAVQFAEARISSADLSSRIKIQKGDVSCLQAADWSTQPQELVMMNFLGHDMWPLDKALLTFSRLRTCFGRCHRFIMADTVRSDWNGLNQPPIFTTAFELIHAIMGKYIPSIAEWKDLFIRTNWRLDRLVPLAVPHSYAFVLSPALTSPHNGQSRQLRPC